MPLAQLTAWCAARFGNVQSKVTQVRGDMTFPASVGCDQSKAAVGSAIYGAGRKQILEQIAQHAEAHPEWLEVSGCE